MKICHVTQYCHAGSVGGTERYLRDLLLDLESRGIAGRILWLTSEEGGQASVYDGVDVVPVFSPGSRIDPPHSGVAEKARDALFSDWQPDLVHFHTFGLAEAAVAELASANGLPYVFTYHSPAWMCRRETLLRWGDAICDGRVRRIRCSACKLQERTGGNPALGYVGACISACLGWPLHGSATDGIRRRLAFVQDTSRFRRRLKSFLSDCSLVVACSNWGVPVLAANGAGRDRTVVCPQGASCEFMAASGAGSAPVDGGGISGRYTVGYVGRPSPEKGIDVLLEGFRMTDEPMAQLRIVGWSEDTGRERYVRRVAAMASEDARVELVGRLGLTEMVAQYRQLSILAIPSVWLETGPLVLFEAQAMGVPVFGSATVGQQDLLARYGHVVEPNTPRQWASALSQAFAALRAGRSPVPGDTENVPLRSMRDVGDEMQRHYGRVIAADRPQSPLNPDS